MKQDPDTTDTEDTISFLALSSSEFELLAQAGVHHFFLSFYMFVD